MAAPSAPPEDISVDEIYPESVYLSWRPPLSVYHNGEIIGYNVTLSAVNSGVVSNTLSATNSTAVTSLNPYVTYIVIVAAVTSAGSGPYSIAVTFTTDEAGNYYSS